MRKYNVFIQINSQIHHLPSIIRDHDLTDSRRRMGSVNGSFQSKPYDRLCLKGALLRRVAMYSISNQSIGGQDPCDGSAARFGVQGPRVEERREEESTQKGREM